jgi:hypothetical protein
VNITVQIDEITLNTVVADVVSFDEDGDAVYEGQQKTVADLVADRIVTKVAGSPEFTELRKRVTAIRDEMIRAKLEPVIAEAMQAPMRKTNWMGEPSGETLTMRELIVEAARDVVSKPDRSGRNQASWVQNFIYDEVRSLFEKELKVELKEAREKLKKEIASRVAASSVAAVTEALGGRL